MDKINIATQFEFGKLITSSMNINFEDVEWTPHKKFEGVYLKHLITSAQTNGEFSYHLIRIEPNMKIGIHTHENQVETHEIIYGMGVCNVFDKIYSYEPGTVAIMPKNTPHEIQAFDDGMYLLAKFFPSLC